MEFLETRKRKSILWFLLYQSKTLQISIVIYWIFCYDFELLQKCGFGQSVILASDTLVGETDWPGFFCFLGEQRVKKISNLYLENLRWILSLFKKKNLPFGDQRMKKKSYGGQKAAKNWPNCHSAKASLAKVLTRRTTSLLEILQLLLVTLYRTK